MCSSTLPESTSSYNGHYVNKILLFGTIIGMLCLISGSFVILLWAFIPKFIKLNSLAVKINAVICVIGVMIVLVNTVYMYCTQFRITSNRKRRKKKMNTSKSGVHYSDGQLHPEDDSFITNYQFSALSSLSMPEVFTSNGDLMKKTFVSLGSLELEKFEVVGVAHRTSSYLDFGRVNEGGEISISEKCNYSYPNILIVDKFSNILSGKTLYFHNTNGHDNKDTVYLAATTDTVHTTTNVFKAAHNSYPNDACNKLKNWKMPKTTKNMLYSLPRVSIQGIKEITSDIPTSTPSSSHFVTVRRTRSDRIKRGKINRSVVIPATCYSMDSSAFSKLENTIHNNNMNISALDSISDNEEYHLITSEAITNRHKPSTDSEMSTVDNCTSYTANATPFICQASLFNLNINNTGVTDDSRNVNSNSNIGNIDEKTAETRHTEAPTVLSGNRIVATGISQYDLSTNKTTCQENNNVNTNSLSQFQQHLQNNCHVLSCATLFNNDEENLSNNNSNGDDNKVFTMKTEGDRLKHLQGIYSKWSVFPVYIGNENTIRCNDGSIDKEDENSEKCSLSKRPSNPTVSHHAKGPLHSIINPIRSLVTKMKTRWIICRLRKKQISRTKKTCHHQMKTRTRKRPKVKSISKESVHEFSDSSLTQDSDIKLEVDNEGKHRRQTIITNASIFSLPAIPPALWNAERPVWIMGVPLNNDSANNDDHWFKVDASKVILLKQKSELNNLTDNPHITGSSSSIYAFHVRPPPRLKPVTTKLSQLQCELRLHQHTRARSVGQMLTSEKLPLNIT
ncbi:hypothetical protein MN116_008435 [Schistosoma mekongi]|uniref:Uncharacterized protein n=1 Tax=Schistosoma mekongi TaxID=38744 RepID=A0AAE1Z715_SCHME|nr:hypothetical protein MN116_008435 [Schistosoma mekongi]